MPSWLPYLLPVAAYLLGAVPFGLLMGFAAGKDVRQVGSGNIGATNVLRTCGPLWGISAFLLDVAKGLGPVLLAVHVLQLDAAVVAATGLAAVVGHNYPVWLGFAGGKGVATTAGVLLAVVPLPGAIALGVFALVVVVSRYVSLSSMTAALALVVTHVSLAPAPWGAELPFTIMVIAMAALVFLRHRENIQRLRAGTENRFGAKKSDG